MGSPGDARAFAQVFDFLGRFYEPHFVEDFRGVQNASRAVVALARAAQNIGGVLEDAAIPIRVASVVVVYDGMIAQEQGQIAIKIGDALGILDVQLLPGGLQAQHAPRPDLGLFVLRSQVKARLVLVHDQDAVFFLKTRKILKVRVLTKAVVHVV